MRLNNRIMANSLFESGLNPHGSIVLSRGDSWQLSYVATSHLADSYGNHVQSWLVAAATSHPRCMLRSRQRWNVDRLREPFVWGGSCM